MCGRMFFFRRFVAEGDENGTKYVDAERQRAPAPGPAASGRGTDKLSTVPSRIRPFLRPAPHRRALGVEDAPPDNHVLFAEAVALDHLGADGGRQIFLHQRVHLGATCFLPA